MSMYDEGSSIALTGRTCGMETAVEHDRGVVEELVRHGLPAPVAGYLSDPRSARAI